jgi:hypothetical protein
MGVAQSVSGAAGLAIGAPIAVVDPDMRRSYSEQANQLMRAADNAVTAGFGWSRRQRPARNHQAPEVCLTRATLGLVAAAQ